MVHEGHYPSNAGNPTFRSGHHEQDHHLSYAVSPDSTATDFLPTQEAAATYVRALRDRLRSYLPRPDPGVQ